MKFSVVKIRHARPAPRQACDCSDRGRGLVSPAHRTLNSVVLRLVPLIDDCLDRAVTPNDRTITLAMEEYIFPFNDKEPLAHQDDIICVRLWNDLWKFVEESKDCSYFDATKLLTAKSLYSRIEWHGRYGAALLFQTTHVGGVKIIVVGLDGWTASVHASIAKRTPIAIADFRNPMVYSHQEIKEENLESVCAVLRQKLSKSEANNTGDRRGQHQGHQGNQKTPSFVSHLMKEAIAEIESQKALNTSTWGGTTDVGLHTGCVLRNTSFPLVLSVLHTILVDKRELLGSRELFEKCVASYLLGFASGINNPSGKLYNARYCDRIISIMHESHCFVDRVQDNDFRRKMVEEMKSYRENLKSLQLNERIAVQNVSFEDVLQSLRSPKFPPLELPVYHMSNLAMIDRSRKEAQQNLDISDIESKAFTGREQDCWFQLNLFNEHFWNLSKHLGSSDAIDIAEERKDLDIFCKVVDQILNGTSTTNELLTSVVFRSYKTLAIWIVFCASHQVAENCFPVLKNYGAALLADDTSFLVLDDHRGMEALKCVTTFLQKRNGTRRPFRDPESTLVLALDVSRSIPSMEIARAEEFRLSNAFIDKRWMGVKKQQRKLQTLDSQLVDAKATLSNAEVCFKAALSSGYYEQDGRYNHGPGYYTALAAKKDAKSKFSSLLNQIRQLEVKPPNVEFTLPRLPEMALQWLFFLMMPVEFQDLCALIHAGEASLRKACPAVPSWLNLHSWFSEHKRSSVHALPTDPTQRLHSKSQPPRFGTPDIRSYSRETGVFFPENLTMDPLWQSTNPFDGFNGQESTLLYTEFLPTGVEGSNVLQSFVPMLPSPLRENEFISAQQKRPKWMSPDELEAFSGLRAHPRSQFRSLVDAVSLGRLPFDNPCVHVLIRHALFQLGHDDWKTDTIEQWKGLDVLSDELRKSLDNLRETPTHWRQLQLFGEICAFYGQQNAVCNELACQYSVALMSLANEMKVAKEIAGTISTDLYRKQGKLYGAAIMCHSVGSRDTEALNSILKLSILLKRAFLFEKAAASLEGILVHKFQSELEPFVQTMVCINARRIVAIDNLVRASPEILTECLGHVVEDAPRSLSWKPVSVWNVSRSGCYEAEHGAHLYSINILNGNVLVNGAPPGLLPSSVTSNPLYCRTFGTRNFEVVTEGFGKYKTARLEDDAFYRFAVDEQGTLFISELSVSVSRDGDSTMGTYEDGDSILELVLLHRQRVDLPVRFQEMHSHWLIPDRNIVVVRGPTYQERNVQLLMTKSNTYVVPVSCQTASIDSLSTSFDQFDRLCHGETHHSRVLGRFEKKEYIHISLNLLRQVVKYSLPRFLLVFEQGGGSARCVQFDGYSLALDQSFDDTLPGLSQVLILKDKAGCIKVLVPDGKVCAESKILVPTAFDDLLFYRIYDEHRRLKSLDATDTVGRLHLAAIFASNASSLLDCRTGKPAFQLSINLLRQCWRNEPFSPTERAKLLEVTEHSKLCCSLRLMCSYIFNCSDQCEFLHHLSSEASNTTPFMSMDTLALDEYDQKARSEKMKCTIPRLRTDEERSFFGDVPLPLMKSANALLLDQMTPVSSYVLGVDSSLLEKLVESPRDQNSFPLKAAANLSSLETQVIKDLEESYRTYLSDPLLRAPIDVKFETAVQVQYLEVQKMRSNEEKKLLQRFSVNSLDKAMFTFSGKRARPSVYDLLLLLTDPMLVREQYCQAQETIDESLKLKVIDWARLCVLEDKLRRIVALDPSKDQNAIVEELQCVRKWNLFPIRGGSYLRLSSKYRSAHTSTKLFGS